MRVSPYPLPSAVASSSYTVSAEGYPDYTANAITSDEAAAAYREAAAGDTDGNLKAQYKMVLSSGCICRVYQYGFRGFYFA